MAGDGTATPGKDGKTQDTRRGRGRDRSGPDRFICRPHPARNRPKPSNCVGRSRLSSAFSPRWPFPWSSWDWRWGTSRPSSIWRRVWQRSMPSLRAGELMADQLRVAIHTEYDIVTARHQGASPVHQAELLEWGTDARGHLRLGAGSKHRGVRWVGRDRDESGRPEGGKGDQYRRPRQGSRYP